MLSIMARTKQLKLNSGDNPFKLMLDGKEMGRLNMKVNPDNSLSIINISLKKWVQ
jgi:hypothetical protein